MLRARGYASRLHSETWFWAMELSVFVSLFLTILITARVPISSLGIDSWSASSVLPTDFVLSVLGITIVAYLFRSWILPALRRLGVAALWGGRYTGADFLQPLHVTFSFIEKELFDKANRVQLEGLSSIAPHPTNEALDAALSSANSIEGPSLPSHRRRTDNVVPRVVGGKAPGSGI
jgi:hypothetical protein